MANPLDRITRIEGGFVVPRTARFAIVATRFSSFVVEQLLEGALDTLVRHDVDPTRIVVVRVPGAWELPLACSRLADTGKFQALIALGAVVRGGTPHFEYIATEVAKGLARAAVDAEVPVAFGVLTTDTLEQAVERAGTKLGNKGAEAAMAALEMVSLGEALSKAKY